MSLNSFQSNSNSIALNNNNNNGSTLECYDSSIEEKSVGCSSLRVRFRMITRKNDQFKARISSSISTSSMSISTASTPNTATLNSNPMLLNSASLATVAGGCSGKDLSNGSSSSLSSFSLNQQQLQPQRQPLTLHHHYHHHHHHNNNFIEIKQNNQSVNHAVFFYNTNPHTQLQKLHSHSMSSRELVEPKNIPINIGLVKSQGPASLSTTKTFRLTEDLKSNIQFDITLKPTFSIRDDRLDASNSNLRSSSCELNSSCSNFDAEPTNNDNHHHHHYISTNKNNNNNTNTNTNRRVVSIINRSSRQQKEQLVSHDQQINQIQIKSNNNENNQINNNYNKVYHHSSMIRLSINRSNGSNSNSGHNSPRNIKSQSNINSSLAELSNTHIEENSKIIKRVVSPFTYIETYSTRRQMSISPNCPATKTDSKQARVFFFFVFFFSPILHL